MAVILVQAMPVNPVQAMPVIPVQAMPIGGIMPYWIEFKLYGIQKERTLRYYDSW